MIGVDELFGVVVSWVTKKLGRRQHRGEVLDAIALELHELRFTLTGVLILLHSKMHTMDQATVDLIRPTMLGYKGEGGDRALTQAATKLLEQGDAAFIAAHNQRPTDHAKAYYPMPYTAPLLTAHLGDLTIPAPVRKQLLRVARVLDLFNQQVAFVRTAHDRTFESLSSANYAANDRNLKEGTARLAMMTADLIVAINDVVDPEGKRR